MGEKKEKKATSSITNKASRRVKQGFMTVGAGAFLAGAIASAVLGGKSKSIDKEALEAFDDFSKTSQHEIMQEETSADVIVALPTAPATTEKVETEQGVVEVETQEVVTEENQPALVINVKAEVSKEDKIAQYLQERKEEKSATKTGTDTTRHLTAEEIKNNFKTQVTYRGSAQSSVEEEKVEPVVEEVEAQEEVKTPVQSQKAEKPTGYILEDVETSETETPITENVDVIVPQEEIHIPTAPKPAVVEKVETKAEEKNIDFSLNTGVSFDSKANAQVATSPSTTVAVSKNEGLMFSFAAGPSLVVSGKGINFDLAMGVALSINLSEHTQFYTSVVAGTGVPLGKNATFGDLLRNGAAVASAGIKITWGGKNVKYTPNLSSVSGAIRHNVKLTPSNPSTPDNPVNPDNPTGGKGNISYDTGHYDETPSNGNTSIGADQGTITPSNPFPDNDSFGFDFER